MIRAPKSFSDIAGHPKAGIVGLVQRQADHDGFVVHHLLHASPRLGAEPSHGTRPHGAILDARPASKLT